MAQPANGLDSDFELLGVRNKKALMRPDSVSQYIKGAIRSKGTDSSAGSVVTEQ